MRGVNLGNWLVVEKWMDPSIFGDLPVDDEFGLSQIPLGRERLTAHRKTYIQEADIAWLADHDIEFLRLPIGYWTIEDGELSYVDWLMQMAKKYNMKVLVCLHGAPGSQNGNDHSGHSGHARWFLHRTLQDKTTQLLIEVAERYKNELAFWGIELLNEPAFGWAEYWTLRRFYRRTYKALKKVLRSGVYTVFSDAYAPVLMAGMLRGSKKFPVAMDVHWYSFATKWPEGESVLGHFKRVQRRRWTLWFARLAHPLIIGEWSATLPNEKVAAAGRTEYEKQNYVLQRKLYDGVLAECYWSYKTSGKSAWNFRHITEEKY